MSSENPSEIIPKKYSLLVMESAKAARNANAIMIKLDEGFSVILFSEVILMFFHR